VGTNSVCVYTAGTSESYVCHRACAVAVFVWGTVFETNVVAEHLITQINVG